MGMSQRSRSSTRVTPAPVTVMSSGSDAHGLGRVEPPAGLLGDATQELGAPPGAEVLLVAGRRVAGRSRRCPSDRPSRRGRDLHLVVPVLVGGRGRHGVLAVPLHGPLHGHLGAPARWGS